jgi:hypothetical protein
MIDTSIIDADQQHLKLLSIFYYVAGGMLYLIGFFPMMHLILGILMLTGMLGAEVALRMIGCFMIFIPLLFMFSACAQASLMIVSGRKIENRISYTFCLVMTGIECLFRPFGTILGVLTIIVLYRPSVKSQFAA